MKEEFFCYSCRRYHPVRVKVERLGCKPLCQSCVDKVILNSNPGTVVNTLKGGDITHQHQTNKKRQRAAKSAERRSQYLPK